MELGGKMNDLEDIQNGILVYYKDGQIKVDEVCKGVWTNRQSKWVEKFNPDKMLKISKDYNDYIVIGINEGV
jgi:hypothetical protein